MRASFITTMRVAVDRISSRIWLTRITAPPWAMKRLTWARSCAARPASSEEVGSSRITRRGGAVGEEKAIAISTIWRWAMDNSPTWARGSMPWPGKIASRLSPTIRRAVPRQPKAGRSRWAMRAFSIMERLGQSDNSWNTQRTPKVRARAMPYGPLPMLPRRGVRPPFRTEINVDLPAPLWPTRPMHSPDSMVSETPSSAVTSPKRTAIS